ncbi:4'-phosphopantetheinyl transferase family protein [Streptomyces bluensis]|uniref:4'-phosphopantetheinyl transferase n=1 Tax=Streptomyces bluensis TaxID=33897 RepID=A0ABW6UJ73_9ACTN
MIEELLPESVVAVEAYGEYAADAADAARAAGGPEDVSLFPEEEAVIAKAVPKRRREFTAVRGCARRAMEKLGVPPQAVLPGERGAPAWPDGLVGSMTHCEGYCAAALVRAADVASLGIDAEPHLPLPNGVLGAIALPTEEARLHRLNSERPGVHWDRLLFSAKESVYKAWFPLTAQWLDFSEADIDVLADSGTPTGAGSGVFRARLLVPGPVVDGQRIGLFDGRWTVRDGLLATAVSVPYPTGRAKAAG